jgi:hypothetical protein
MHTFNICTGRNINECSPTYKEWARARMDDGFYKRCCASRLDQIQDSRARMLQKRYRSSELPCNGTSLFMIFSVGNLPSS